MSVRYQSVVFSTMALPALTAPLVTVVATPTAADPAATPTLTAAAPTETVVETTVIAVQPLEISAAATQML